MLIEGPLEATDGETFLNPAVAFLEGLPSHLDHKFALLQPLRREDPWMLKRP